MVYLYVALLQEPTTDGFEFTTDSNDATGGTIFFDLAGFFVVTEVQLQFPVGDTYKFDLSVSSRESTTLITVRENIIAMSRPLVSAAKRYTRTLLHGHRTHNT